MKHSINTVCSLSPRRAPVTRRYVTTPPLCAARWLLDEASCERRSAEELRAAGAHPSQAAVQREAAGALHAKPRPCSSLSRSKKTEEGSSEVDRGQSAGVCAPQVSGGIRVTPRFSGQSGSRFLPSFHLSHFLFSMHTSTLIRLLTPPPTNTHLVAASALSQLLPKVLTPDWVALC